MKLKIYISIIIFLVLLLVIIKTKKDKKSKLNKKYYNTEDITQPFDDITATLTLDEGIELILEKNIVVVHSEKTIY